MVRLTRPCPAEVRLTPPYPTENRRKLAMDSSWRAGLTQDSRNRIANRIMDTLQGHTPLSGQDGMNKLWKIANRFEERIFYSATDQHDYLRKLSLKILNLEQRTQNAPNGSLPTSSTGTNQTSVATLDNGLTMDSSWRAGLAQDSPWESGFKLESGPCTGLTMDSSWRAGLAQDSRNKIVNRIMDTLQRHTPLSGQDGINELWKIANRFEEKIFYAATDQSDYLRKISFKMLNLEARTQNAPNGSLPTSSTGTNQTSVTTLDNAVRIPMKRKRTCRGASVSIGAKRKMTEGQVTKK